MVDGWRLAVGRDLAELYAVETRVLNQAVRRNQKRFPSDFMFVLTSVEMENWKSQIVISNRERMGLRKPPLANQQTRLLATGYRLLATVN